VSGPSSGGLLRGNRARLLILTLAHFTVDFCGGLTIPLPEPTLVQHLGTTLPRVAFLIGGCAIVVNVVQPVSGWLLPARGVPALLPVATAAAALITCIGLTKSYWAVGMLLLVGGVGIGVLHPEGALAAHSVSGRRKGLGMSLFMSGGYLGFATGSLVAGVWVEVMNQDLTYLWVMAAPAVVTVALILTSGLHRLEGHVTAEPAGSGEGKLPFAPILALTVAIAVTLCIFVRFITIWLVREFPGQPAQGWGGTAVFASGLAGAAAAVFWGHLSDRFGRGKVIALTQVLCVPFLYQVLHVHSPSAVPLWALGIGATLGGIFPLSVVLARESHGLGQRIRIGLAIGGAWGLGEVAFILASRYVGRFPATAAAPVARVLSLCGVGLAMIALLSLWLTRLESRQRVDLAA